MIAPWLPVTDKSSTKRLEADLKARGWRVWWTQGGSVRLFSPEGDTIEVDGATAAQAMRNAYASAQEHSNAQTSWLLREAMELSDELAIPVRA